MRSVDESDETKECRYGEGGCISLLELGHAAMSYWVIRRKLLRYGYAPTASVAPPLLTACPPTVFHGASPCESADECETLQQCLGGLCLDASCGDDVVQSGETW